jgi:hypothetical protein
MRKMPPKHLEIVQKMSLSYSAPVTLTRFFTLPYLLLLCPTSLHIAPHHKRDLRHVKRKHKKSKK